MKLIWNVVNKLKVSVRCKNGLFLLLCAVALGIIGALLWCIIGQFVYLESLMLIVFAGYPAVFGGYFGGSFYLYNHEFYTDFT